MAPLNPAFIAYRQQPAHVTRTASGHPTWVSTRANAELRVDDVPARGDALFSLAYDLRTVTPAKLSPIEDQGQSGCCWVFATCGSLESCLLPAGCLDFFREHEE